MQLFYHDPNSGHCRRSVHQLYVPCADNWRDTVSDNSVFTSVVPTLKHCQSNAVHWRIRASDNR